MVMQEPLTLTLERAEVNARIQAVAARAAEQGLDALVIVDPANVYYLSGFRTTLHTRFTAVVVRVGAPAEALMVVPGVDRKLALEPIWYPSLIENTKIYYEGAPADGPLVNAPGPLIAELVRDGDTVGIDLAGASYGQVQLIMSNFPASRIADASEIMHDVRRVKSPFEIAALKAANQVAIKVLKQVPSLLHVGMTEVDLASALDTAARAAGADDFAYPTLIGFGPKSLAPHAPPLQRGLEVDNTVTIAFGPMVAGYCADIVRTFYYGTPPELAILSGQRTTEVQAAALAQVKAGARAGALMTAAREVIFRLHPDAPSMGRAGHSLGLTIHETPSLTSDNEMILAENMVLAVEPGAFGSAMEGIGLYRHCDVVLVTADGYELLTPMDRGLLVVPA